MLSRAGVEFKNIKFIHKNFPLDNACNKTLDGQYHKNSCMLAKYSIAAEKQGRLWDMNAELFETQPKNEEEVLKLAEKMGFDVKKLKIDANSKETEKKLLQDIDDALDDKVTGTPAIVINGKIHSGIMPYYDLKDLLIKSGAQE